MKAGEPSPPRHVPTLTEVIGIDQWRQAPSLFEPDAAAGQAAPTPMPTEEQVVRRVLGELQHQIDVMLEYRIREVLGPLLARAADNVVRDARSELASTLRDVVARAVAAEMARQRER